jgi:3,4-dihydroxy-2-butanone 4-phosphate synthase
MLGDGIRRNIATISDEERTLFVNALLQLDDPTSAFVYPGNLGHEGADASGYITYWDMQEQIHKNPHS